MRGEKGEPTNASDIKSIAEAILSFDPLVVVITGGDPLVSPHLTRAINYLSGKVGIVVDTNGYGLKDHHIDLFATHNVAVRISLDSERPKVNEFLRRLLERPFRSHTPSTSASALDAICRSLDAGLTVTIQTVATNKTATDLVAFGDKLYRLGVRSWRILQIAPSSKNMDWYRKLSLSPKAWEYVSDKVHEAQEKFWKREMAVQTESNRIVNSVILVAPDGTFHTESNQRPQKVVIDSQTPRRPRTGEIVRQVNMGCHATRYLNAPDRSGGGQSNAQ